MTLRDMQRDIRKGDFSRGAVSSRIPYVGRPKTVAGRAGAAVGKYPKTSATVGGLTLVALGAGGTKMYDGRDKKFSRKVSKKWEKEDTASVGIGGAAGAAVMPTRQPKAHGQRKYALNEMYSRAERAATDGVADIKISPTELGQTAEHKGRRAYNKGYTAASAVWNGHPADARYEIDMYKDKKGNIRTRQVNGRHLAEVRNMQEQDIPTRVRLVEGEAPESPAFKTAMRYIRSRKERRQLRDERNLNPDTIKSRAKAYEGRLGSVARVANEKAHRYLHKPGETPIKVGKPHLRGRQAAYIAGGAGTMYVGNRLLRGENRGPTQQITSTSNKYSDLARKKVAEAIDPVNKRDNKDRYAAGAGGALASAAAMPVRESAGGPGAKVAERLRDLPEGMQEVKSSDIMDVAAPGVRRGNKDYTTRMAADIHRGTWDPEPGRIQITDDGVRVTGGQHRAVARAWAGQPTQRMEVVRTPGRMGGTSPGVVAAAKQVKRRLAPMWYKRNAPKSTKELLERDAKGSEKKIAHAKGHSTPSKAALDPVMDLKGLRRLHRKQAAIVAGGTAAALGANEYRRWYTGQDSIMKAAPIRFKKVDFVEGAHRSEKGYTMKKKAQGHAQRVVFTPVEKKMKFNFHPVRNRIDRAVAERSRLAGQNFTQGAADAMKANMPKVDTNIGAVGEGIKRAGQAVGVGAGTGGLVAGASKVIGDALGANATRKAASESTKRAKYYAGAGLGGAGLIGGGLALNRRK